MQIGLFSNLVLADPSQRPGDVLETSKEMVRRADDLGFDVAWFAEHHFSAFSLCASPLAMAMHCAGFTRRIRLGVNAIVLPLHHPLRVIEEIGMLDQLSGGRAVVGIGTGCHPHEYRSFGLGMDDRVGRLFECWSLLRTAWRHGRLKHKGRFYEIPETAFALRPVGNRHPELFVAADGQAVLERAARDNAAIFIPPGTITTAQLHAARAEALAAAAGIGIAAADLKLAIQRHCFVTDDPHAARQAAQHLVHFMRRQNILKREFPPRAGIHVNSIPFDGEPGVDWLLANAAIGSAEVVAERLLADLRALTPYHLSIDMGFSPLPPREVLKSLDLFGAHVLPRLRHAGGAA